MKNRLLLQKKVIVFLCFIACCLLILICKKYSGLFLEREIGHWEKTGNMVEARGNELSAVLMADGNVLITGGYIKEKGYTNTAEIYYPKENIFKSTGSMLHKRHNHNSYLLKDGRVVIIGGQTQSLDGYTNDVEIYNPKTGTFSKTDTLPKRIGDYTVMLDDGYICDVKFCYNPLTKQVKQLPEINYDRMYSDLLYFSKTSFLLFGGWVMNNVSYGKLNNTISPRKGDGYIISDNVEEYSQKKGFELKGNLNKARYSSCAITLPDKNVLIIGGLGHKHDKELDINVYNKNLYPFYKKHHNGFHWWQNYIQDIELYNPKNNSSTTVGKIRYAVGNCTNSDLILLNGRYVYIANGAGKKEEIIDIKNFKTYPTKKMKPKIVGKAVKLNEKQILFLGKTDYHKNLKRGLIFTSNIVD